MKKAFGIIDAQRGFMPATEGERLELSGFGELAVENGEEIVAPINRLLARAASNLWVFTTQDFHPPTTAHFKKDGGIWPTHCVAETDGARIHPAIILPPEVAHLKKGQKTLAVGEIDDSYSGWNATREVLTAFNEKRELTLEDELRARKIDQVFLAGLAFDYCVGETALDLARHDFSVSVIEDATRGISPETIAKMREKLRIAGVKIVNSAEIIKEIEEEKL